MLSDAAFIRVNFEKTRKNTVFLNEEKARMLLIRYAGRSIALPAHTGIHDEVYGSLAVYRKEVREFLQNYREDHPDEDAAAILMKAAGEDPVLQTAAKEL